MGNKKSRKPRLSVKLMRKRKAQSLVRFRKGLNMIDPFTTTRLNVPGAPKPKKPRVSQQKKEDVDVGHTSIPSEGPHRLRRRRWQPGEPQPSTSVEACGSSAFSEWVELPVASQPAKLEQSSENVAGAGDPLAASSSVPQIKIENSDGVPEWVALPTASQPTESEEACGTSVSSDWVVEPTASPPNSLIRIENVHSLLDVEGTCGTPVYSDSMVAPVACSKKPAQKKLDQKEPSRKKPGRAPKRSLFTARPSGDLLKMVSDAEDDDDDDGFCDTFDGLISGRQIISDDTDEEDKEPPSSLIKNEDHSSSLYQFNWQPFPEDVPPTARREAFTGATGPIRNFRTPYEAFIAIWDAEIMQVLVDETNRYANRQLRAEKEANSTMGHCSRISKWRDTDVDELMVYFGILMAMSLCFKGNVIDYWGEGGQVTQTPNFGQYMSLNRYSLLSKCLHFRNNLEVAQLIIEHRLSSSEIKMAKMEPLITHLNTKFQALYNLSRNIVIEESLVQWKGWFQIKQFIRNKAACEGIRTFELCDSKNGYLWRFELYTGADHTNPVPNNVTSPLEGKINQLVLRMLKRLEFSNRTVWMDDYYNSPLLARYLKSIGLDCAGTFLTNRQFVPEELRNLEKSQMVQGEIVGCTTGDVDVMVWRDKNQVAMISTYHGIGVCTTAKKPLVVLDYNVQMAGVDRKDQLLSQYPIDRKRTKIWYQKLFRRLLNTSITNAYILYSESCGVPIKGHRNFRKVLMNSLLDNHSKIPPPVTIVSLKTSPFKSIVLKSSSTAKNFTPVMLGKVMVKHFPKQYPIAENAQYARIQRTCTVCRQLTVSYCPGCEVPLCTFSKSDDVESCFITHHDRVK